MKRIYRILAVALICAVSFSCKNDFLDTKSPSVVDANFVFSDFSTAKTVMLGAYNDMLRTNTHSDGFFKSVDNIGSDVERASVGLVAQLVGASQLYGGKPNYEVENCDISEKAYIRNIWGRMYSIIAKCNNVIANIQALDNFEEIMATAPNDWSDLYGQAYALRATMYYDIARYFGDAIYYDETCLGLDIKELTSRDCFIEKEIENLINVEPLMYSIGQNNHMPDQMTQDYVRGLIGRMCFLEAGYATRRTDLGDGFYTDKDGNPLTFEVWGTSATRNCNYSRRTDWKKFYEKALPYLQDAVSSGGATLVTVDPRSDKEGRSYNNPYQYVFDQHTKLVMSDETIYEITIKAEGGGSRIGYDFGRGSNGGGNAYPPKANAQTCSYPEVYYNLFDPQDLRRDASLVVTGSTGYGQEALNNFALSNRLACGIALNKYDTNRQVTPDRRQLYSGINFLVMRKAEVILMLAEAYAQTGQTALAQAELKKIHDRAFPDDIQDAKFAELLADNGGDVLEAIYDERAREFVGEGLRRWDLVRTGKMPQVAVEYRAKLVKDMNDLKNNGYVDYPNGNQFPAYVWTKMVDAKEEYGYRLTMQTPAGEENDPVLYPAWRGQHDDWGGIAESYGERDKVNETETNLAIVGLFEYIEPGSAEAQALEAEGYVQTAWGANLTSSDARIAQWSSEFMIGYTDAMYSAKEPPIYLHPMEETVCLTTGLMNGYGYKSKM